MGLRLERRRGCNGLGLEFQANGRRAMLRMAFALGFALASRRGRLEQAHTWPEISNLFALRAPPWRWLVEIDPAAAAPRGA